VLLTYAQPEVSTMVKQTMGFNFLPRALGQQITDSVVELLRAKRVWAVIGQQVGFDDIPAAITAMASRETVGRTIVGVRAGLG
jgi:NADPH:quinone reductase-like Zn-dependent oxidoreductase